jgi:antibiotic biosynthesis monooxygenase (ABM) superfamily enzyme
MKLFTAFKIWIVIYPSITLFLYYLGEPLAAMPLYLRTLLLTIILVPWMIFVGLPILEKVRTAVFRRPVSQKK